MNQCGEITEEMKNGSAGGKTVNEGVMKEKFP